MEGSRADFHVVRLQQRAALAIPELIELKDELVQAGFAEAFLVSQPWPRDAASFAQRLQQGQEQLLALGARLCAALGEALAALHAINKRLKGAVAPQELPALNDIRQQLDRLVARHFVLQTPYPWLLHYPRYLKAVQARLEKLGRSPERDRQQRLELDALWHDYETRAAQGGLSAAQREFRWLLEELRVSLVAQELKTVQPVSVPRLRKLWKELC